MDSKEESSQVSTTSETTDPPLRYRDLIAFWILGLCNNFGYVVMLSAAHDILESEGIEESSTPAPVETFSNERQCNEISTGAILLADVIPSLFIKVLSPFLPQHTSGRVIGCVILSAAGYLTVAFAETYFISILGVIITSLACGLGESSFLAYSYYYNRNVISTWSSGTGGAGVFGSISYALLTQLGLDARTTLLLMLTIPMLMSISYWVILSKPKKVIKKDPLPHPTQQQEQQQQQETSSEKQHQPQPLHCSEKFKSILHNIRDTASKIPPLFVYMLPLGLVYFFEYFINQGLFELVDFEDIWLNRKQQYRWLNVTYQIGVFISRSSVNICLVKNIWILAILQGLNSILFTAETMFYISPSIWIVLLFTIWEGLLGGGAYVNTFYKISHEVPDEQREFSLGAVSMSDSFGITLAGFSAIPIHNAICRLPLPNRKFVGVF